jgi:hypothetical protein
VVGYNPREIIITLQAEAKLTACNWYNLDAVCIWTDRSYMDDHMGAGFVQEVNSTLISSEFYLGKYVEVFDVELFAIDRVLCNF